MKRYWVNLVTKAFRIETLVQSLMADASKLNIDTKSKFVTEVTTKVVAGGRITQISYVVSEFNGAAFTLVMQLHSAGWMINIEYCDEYWVCFPKSLTGSATIRQILVGKTTNGVFEKELKYYNYRALFT